jgi:hypothetical protein
MKSIVSFGFLTIFAALVIAISCQKSDNNSPEPPQNGQKEYVNASIAGTTCKRRRGKGRLIDRYFRYQW